MQDPAALRLNGQQKMVFALLVALIVLMMLPSVLPKELFLAQLLNQLGATGIAAAIVALMCIIPLGKPKLLLLLAAVMVVSGALNNDSVGFVSFLKLLLDPVFGHASAVFFVLALIGCAVVFTNFCNNAATAIALLPVVLAFAQALDISASLVAVVITFSVMLAFLTPAASPSAALLHGNDWLCKKDIYQLGFIAIAASIVVLYIVTFTIGQLLY